MTLTFHDELEQGSDEWLRARCGILTASVIGSLITTGIVGPSGYACPDCGVAVDEPCLSKTSKTPKPIQTYHKDRGDIAAQVGAQRLEVATGDTARALTMSLAAERITGRVDPVYVNADMQRGHDEEPLARDLYAEHYKVDVEEVGFIVREEDGIRIGYSPDGLVPDDGLIEVKSRRQKGHVANAVAGDVPPANMAQLQAGLVTGRAWCDYLDFSNGMAMWIVRVFPDPAWFAVIEAAARKFEQDVADIQTAYDEATTGMPMAEYVEPWSGDDITF